MTGRRGGSSGRRSLVVNGRFLRARPTGLHRPARSLLRALEATGLSTEVLAPPGVTDPLAHKIVWGPPGRAGDHLWEQAVLPAAARSRTILSLANTAPVYARHGVVVVYDLATLVGPQWFARGLTLYGRLTLMAARRADAVVTASRQVAGELEAAGVRSDRIHVIHIAIGPEFRRADEEEIHRVRTRHRLQGPYAILVGWADPRKGVEIALSAHEAVVKDLPHDLVLVGGRHPNFAPVAQPRGPNVRVLGYLKDDELPPLISGASALLYPSAYEGFGLPPLEAMACGTPAIVSDLPSVREATSGVATYLPRDDDRGWAEALGEAIKGDLHAEEPEKRTWEDVAGDFRRLLEHLGR